MRVCRDKYCIIIFTDKRKILLTSDMNDDELVEQLLALCFFSRKISKPKAEQKRKQTEE